MTTVDLDEILELTWFSLNKDIDLMSDRFFVSLGGVELILDCAWNEEEGGIFVDCYDLEGESVFDGKKMILSENIFDGVIDNRLPVGVRLIPLDLTGESEQEGITLDKIKSETIKLYIIEG